jgi:hypothetical protein
VAGFAAQGLGLGRLFRACGSILPSAASGPRGARAEAQECTRNIGWDEEREGEKGGFINKPSNHSEEDIVETLIF